MSQPEKRALIVDDERSLRYVLSKQLGELGYRCVAVASGREALEKIAQQRFDVMLLDLRMPGMSGLEVLRRLRAQDPELCVVMLTAMVDVDLAAQALRLGADDFLTKPYSQEELISRLEKALERRQLPGGKAGAPVNPREITKDLVAQQMSGFQELTQPAEKGRRPARRWLSWLLRR